MKRINATAAAAVIGAAAAFAAGPSFPGGEQAFKAYIDRNLVYPPHALANGIEGVVTVTFTVNADGSVSGVKATTLIDPELEAEAGRLVREMPRWTPADKDGVPVAATTDVRISFELPE